MDKSKDKELEGLVMEWRKAPSEQLVDRILSHPTIEWLTSYPARMVDWANRDDAEQHLRITLWQQVLPNWDPEGATFFGYAWMVLHRRLSDWKCTLKPRGYKARSSPKPPKVLSLSSPPPDSYCGNGTWDEILPAAIDRKDDPELEDLDQMLGELWPRLTPIQAACVSMYAAGMTMDETAEHLDVLWKRGHLQAPGRPLERPCRKAVDNALFKARAVARAVAEEMEA